VRRRICPSCNTPLSSTRAQLPRTGVALALTSAGVKIEHLDQVTTRQDATLLELANGSRLACLLSHADSGPALQGLRGAVLRLGIRRAALGPIHPEDPISYLFKAIADPHTRSAAKSKGHDAAARKQE
jgi:hypothetical protein